MVSAYATWGCGGAGDCGLRGVVVGGVAGLGGGRRFGGLAGVTLEAAVLNFVAQDGHEARAVVALGAVGVGSTLEAYPRVRFALREVAAVAFEGLRERL